jgi:Copper type II ascorbate-dependent monooxygenase, N-terminal domain/Copper type II ascorbate-dependent monooxygenase, C-terminal domain
MRSVFLSSLWLVPMLVWGCGSNGSARPGITGGGGNGSGSNDLPCDVADIVKEKCQSCHAAKPLYGAPMPLMTVADFAAPANSNAAKTVGELVSTRIHDAAKPMPPVPSGPLDATSQAILDEWIAQGMPKGAEMCTPTTSSSTSSTSSGGSLSCTPDVQFRAKNKWVMPKATADEYVCIGADIVAPQKKHITAVAPHIDNSVILHHMLLYETTTAYSPEPTPCAAGGPSSGRLVSVWAPGGQALEFPPEAGMPVEGTKHYMIQMHYSNLMQLDGESDLSGFDICTTTDLRPNDADIMAFGTMKIDVPAHGESDRTCDITVPGILPTINVFYAMPHMHKTGTIISAEVTHANGSKYELANRNPWSFDDQYWDEVLTTVGPGDTVSVRCAWQNPTNVSIGFGEKTEDEMCYVFAAYWPRIALPAWSWQAGAAASQCTNTP